MFSSLLGRALFSVATEEVINGREAQSYISEDPVLAGMGGACVFIYQPFVRQRCINFLLSVEKHPDEARSTNNPSLVKEIKDIVKIPSGVNLMLFSKALKDMLSAAEFEAVYQHECGHIHHRHNETPTSGTHEEFIQRELEADQYSVDQTGDPEALMTGLEKCLRFGTQQAALWEHGTSDSYIRRLIDSDIIDAFTFKKVYLMGKALHKKRFDTLERLVKAKKK
jgi:hypothetical protein